MRHYIRNILITSLVVVIPVLLLTVSWANAFTYEIGYYEGGDPSTETMPGDMYGIKFDVDDLDQTTITVAFDSTRMPEWGDFYARCGSRPEHNDPNDPNYPTPWNSAWNSGFASGETAGAGNDPTEVAGDGSYFYHILVPDTEPPTGDAFSYSGSINLASGLDGTGSWNDVGPTMLSWAVSWDGESEYVHYSYTFSVNQHDISHLTLEASDGFNTGDITNVYINGLQATVVPEPISSSLFIVGGSLLAGRRLFRRKK